MRLATVMKIITWLSLVVGLIGFYVLFSSPTVSAASYYVEIQDGIGAETGDKNQYEDLPPDDSDVDPPEEENQTNHSKKIKNSVLFYDKVNIGIDIDISEDIVIENNSNTTDTAEKPKEPFDWDGIFIWGLIILGIGILLGGAWYIYQIYFY